jgi:hypothetical protein
MGAKMDSGFLLTIPRTLCYVARVPNEVPAGGGRVTASDVLEYAAYDVVRTGTQSYTL